MDAAPIISAEEMARDEVGFPILSEEEMAAARKCGRTQHFAAGQWIFEAGEGPVDFVVIVNGAIAVVDTSSEPDRLIAVNGPGSFLGDTAAFSERPAIVSARAAVPTEVILLNHAAVRRLLVCSAGVGEKWMAALLRRREILEEFGFEGLRVLGEHRDPATLHLRDFLHRNGVPHRWIDTAEPKNAAAVAALDPPPTEFPVIAWADETLMQNPSLALVADRLGVHRAIPDEIFDTVIIGGGPSGLGAAVYAASEGLRTLVLDRVGPGGQAGSSSRIENYAGFPAGLSGRELALRTYLQALKFGATFSAPADVAAVRCVPGGLHVIEMADGSEVRTKTVIVSTGVSYRSLGVTGLRDLRGSGVYYSATQVEALLCDERPVHVIGAGNSAGQAAMFLSKFNCEVNLVVRGGNLAKSMSSYLSERVEVNPRIRIRLHTELRGVIGTASLERVRLENTATGEIIEEESCGAFIFIGAVPCTDFLGPDIRKDERGFLMTGAEVIAAGAWKPTDRLPSPLETSCPGIYAAGDCRSGTTKRVAFAVGDGALAVTCVHDLLGTYD